MYSQTADVSYKRLTREVAVPAGGGSLTFWTPYDTESHWDHLFVEARPVGTEDWTTLPDANGHTTQDTGGSCPAGWRNLQPQLDRYQTLNTDGSCSPTGTTGNAASGNSGGWQQWSVDLSDYAGQTVEISIAYATDWAVQLDPHGLQRLPGRRVHHDPGLGPDGLRVRGDLDAGVAQRGHGPRARPSARLTDAGKGSPLAAPPLPLRRCGNCRYGRLTMAELRVHVAGYPDSDEEERAELAWRLREEIREHGIDDVSQPSVRPPPGSKGGGLEWAQLVVTFAGTVPALVMAVQGWLGRHPNAAVTLEIGGDRLTLDEASAEDRRRLLEAFLARHGAD